MNKPEDIDVAAIREQVQQSQMRALGIVARTGRSYCTTAGWELTASDEQVRDCYFQMAQVAEAQARGCSRCGQPSLIVMCRNGENPYALCAEHARQESGEKEAEMYGGLENSPFRKRRGFLKNVGRYLRLRD